MKFLFCGARDWTDFEAIIVVMRALEYKFGTFTVIEGEAKGADTLARRAAEIIGMPVEKFPANWEKYGRAAGPIRNSEMLEQGKPNAVLAFHEDIANSKGTKNMVDQAIKAGLPVWCSDGGTADSLYKFMSEVKKRFSNGQG